MKSILLGLLVISTISCGKMEELENKTDNIESTMEEMEETMGNMDGNMTSMYLQIRQKESEDTRRKQMAILYDPKMPMASKLTAAKKYFMAFEYQLWTGIGIDNKEYREHLLQDAFDELYRELAGLYEGYSKISPINIDKANIKTEIFYALATTMHFNNYHQKINTNKFEDIAEESIFDLIKKAGSKLNAHQGLTDYEAVSFVGTNEDITKDLLNARYNFVITLAVKNLITKNHMGNMDKIRGLLFNLSNGSVGSLNVDSRFNELNEVTQQDIITKLESAQKLKAYFVGQDSDLKMDKSLKSILDNLERPEQSRANTMSVNEKKVFNLIDGLLK